MSGHGIRERLLVLLVAALGTSAIRGQTLELIALETDLKLPYQDLTEADMDGDGRKDLFFALADPPRWEIRLRLPGNAGFGPPRVIPVPDGVAAIALARVVPPAGYDIVTLAADGLAVIPGGAGGNGKPRPWCRVDLLFPPGHRGVPHHWTWGDDIDGDGRQDVFVPGLEGDLLVRGGADGKPAGPPERMPGPPTRVVRRRTGRGLVEVRRMRPRSELARLYSGASVPAWLGRDGLYAVPRTPTGFAAPMNLFPLKARAQAGLGILRRTDVDLTDLNGDKVCDLVLTRTEAKGGTFPDRRTDLLFFKNTGQPARAPAQVLLLPGVLSSGPDVGDVNGDGIADLFLSVFAGDVKSEALRRMFGFRVTLDYHLYLGTGGARAPFPRSPTLSLSDKVDNRTFETWSLRPRRVLSHDWNGDGILDLVDFKADAKTCTVTVTYGKTEAGRYELGDATTEFTWTGKVTGYGVVSMGEGAAAARLKTATGVVYVTAKR